MIKSKWLQSIPGVMLCVIAFTLPFRYIYSSIACVVLVVSWVLSADIKQTVRNFISRKYLWPWVAYYVLCAASYFWSYNKEASIADLQTKLSILLMPVIIGAGMTISQQWLERILLCFISGITIASIYFISRAGIVWYHTGMTIQFFYHKLTDGYSINAIYYAWYSFFSLSILLFYDWQYFFKNNLFVKVLMVVVQAVFFVLLSSKMLLGLFSLFLVPFYIWRSFKGKKISHTGLGLIVVVSAFVVLLISGTQNPIKKRYQDIEVNSIKKAWHRNYYQNDSSMVFDNTMAVRLFIWRVSFDNIYERKLWWYGCGNGGFTKLLNDKMADYGVVNIYNKDNPSPLYNVNTHNMYLQSLLCLGTLGLFFFVLVMLTPFFFIKYMGAYKDMFLIFHVLCFVFMMQESALQVQGGTVFYSFFSQIFWLIGSDKYIKKS